MMFFGTGWMTDERKPIGKIKMTNNLINCAFLGVAFVVGCLLPIRSMGLLLLYQHAPLKDNHLCGKNTLVPWILWAVFFVVLEFAFVFVVVIAVVAVAVAVNVVVVLVVAVVVSWKSKATPPQCNLPQEIRLTKGWGGHP